MKKSVCLIYLEIKYLFRQKFLWLLVLLGIAVSIYCLPKLNYEMNYQVFEKFNKEHSYEGMSDSEKLIVEYWDTKRTYILQQRKEIYEQAQEKKKTLVKEKRYEEEYLTEIQKKYEEEIVLEVQDYLGWEIFFLHRTAMQPHNPVSFLVILIIASAGLVLLTKDRENNTRSWAVMTGEGTTFKSYLWKIVAAFLYGVFVQLIFNAIFILSLGKIFHLDMRHWFHAIQNIPQYGLCNIRSSIIETILLDMLLKNIVSLSLMLVIVLTACILNKYLFMFLETLAVSGALYYWLFDLCERKDYRFMWYFNPFSIFQLDRLFTYHAVNIANHAVDIRLILGVGWISIIIVLFITSYKVWRKYLYVNLL